MSTTTDPQPESSDHDELVAYLDGELGPADCRAVEERLANDPDYRERLRDLDQAWEALSVLPATAVDDSFARTTIELACVAAEEDLSKHKQLVTVETRSKRRWWIVGGVSAALVGFLMVRGLAVHRNNMVLRDLPVIEQVNTLSFVPDIEFLRGLAASKVLADTVADQATYQHTLEEFKQANAATLEERRAWVDALPAEQKAELAERARAFEELQSNPDKKERVRRLANEITEAKDSDKLQATLVALGQWLAGHDAGKQEDIRVEIADLPAAERVAAIERLVRREGDEAAKRLSPEEAKTLRREIVKLAAERKEELLKALPQGSDFERVKKVDTNNGREALFFVLRAAMRRDENGEDPIDKLVSKLSPETNEHWKRVRQQPGRRYGQLLTWLHDATPEKPRPEELEKFFLSDKLSNSEKQELLNKPKAEMQAELERRYLRSVLGFEFGDVMRGPRTGPGPPGPFGPENGRRGDRPRRPDGFPPFEGPPGPEGPEGRPGDRLPPPGDGPRGYGPGGGRPGEGRPPRRQGDRPEGPPPGGGQPGSPPQDGKPQAI